MDILNHMFVWFDHVEHGHLIRLCPTRKQEAGYICIRHSLATGPYDAMPDTTGYFCIRDVSGYFTFHWVAADMVWGRSAVLPYQTQQDTFASEM